MTNQTDGADKSAAQVSYGTVGHMDSEPPTAVPRTGSETVDFEAKLRSQVENWRKRLLDLGNRNSLISCSFNPSRGVIEIVHPDCDTVWRKLAADAEAGTFAMRFPWRRDLVPPPIDDDIQDGRLRFDGAEAERLQEWNPPLEDCCESPRLRSNDLITAIGDKALDRRLRTLDGHAALSMSEQGVHCLYAAFGFLKWYESADSSIEIWSPLMLVPVGLSRTSTDAPWELTEAEDDVVDNLCLRERLKQDFGMELPPLPDINDLEENDARLRFLDAVRNAVADSVRWEVKDRCALGRFAFPKVAMWKDLGDHSDAVIGHLLCRSIGGDASVAPYQSFGSAEAPPDATKLDDEIPPGQIKAILDCDSSQLEAIVAARKGISFVLDGPPGTGKSQTIANIIADALAEGRRVAFVSEKLSALEVVKKRLDDCGLGDFCLECHSSKANRKTVLEELRGCLEIPVEVYSDPSPKLNEAKQTRDALNNYVRSIHRPRDPHGQSPYELYGHVTRLTRLGLATKSRSLLPDPSAVDRETFNAWLNLIGRAKEVANVLERHDSHPWRGCRLTSRSLSLADDIQHHLGVLADSFSLIATSTKPLIDDGLPSAEVTPARLNETLKALRESLSSPNVPPAWFGNPQVIANAVLGRCAAQAVVDARQPALCDYVDDVAGHNPSDDLIALSDPDRSPWMRQLTKPLPDGVREQCREVASLVTILRNLAMLSAETESPLSALIRQLEVPVRSAVPAAFVPRFVCLARVVAEAGRMNRNWFEADNWTTIRQACNDALAKLDEAATAASRAAGRIRADRLGLLARCVEDLNEVQEGWNAIQSIVDDPTREELESLVRKSDDVSSAVNSLNTAACSLVRALGLGDIRRLSLRSIRAIPESFGPVAEVGVFHGKLADPGTRSQFEKACRAAIADLAEATALRTALEERLSHRAFKTSAADLVGRSAAYGSVLKRLFGGFGSFREAATDFYKSSVPETKTLLADFDRLRAFHSRLRDASQLAAEFAEFLPEGYAFDDPVAWQRVLDSVRAFESVLTAVPELASLLQRTAVNFDRLAVQADLERLKVDLERFRTVIERTPFAAVCRDHTALDDLSEELSTVAKAARDCRQIWDRAVPYFAVPPTSLGKLSVDIGDAEIYTNALEAVRLLFDRHRHFLPHGSTVQERAGWQRALAGIEAAERLSALVQSPESLQEILCGEGRIDSGALLVAADATDVAIQKLNDVVRQIESALILSPPDEAVVEVGRRPLAELRTIALSASDDFAKRAQRLGRIAAIIRPDRDASVARLAGDAAVIADLREAIRHREESEELLRFNGVDLPDDLPGAGHDAAAWLLTLTQTGQMSPLIQAVASDAGHRQQVQVAADQIKHACSGDFKDAWEFLKSLFDLKVSCSSGITIVNTPPGDLAKHLRGLQAQTDLLDEWLKFCRWRRDMQSRDFGPVVDELLAGNFSAEEAADVIAARFYRKLFDHLAAQDQALGEFDIESHERVRERFRELDKWEIKAAATRIRQYQLGREDRPRLSFAAPTTSELGVLRRETQKKRRHMPLRKLFAEIPGVLQKLKPCIMMSPLSVSTFLQTDEIRFDLVIFDEASQVFPWDAIGAIYRGSQLIVAGDEKQLPPTNFFNRGDIESEDEGDDIGDFDSILSLCKSINMPSKRLRWHYRSRREPLIAFSNHHFYDRDLVTFPSVRDATGDAVRLELVPNGQWVDRKNIPEAERVADLVVAHLRERPKTSLGVIAFNASQQQAIEDVIYERRRNAPEIDALFQVGVTDPLFVKNLENVQGDERDVIVLSMGYAQNEAGRFLKNFGPLSKAGGERRLNVAVTRAREEVVLVASVRAADMDLSGSTSQGANLLKAYLEYAERGVTTLPKPVGAFGGETESPFEEDVATALIRHGLTPVSQVGCGGFRIDLALPHPNRPGEFCLGIECDGATYHSSKTARDRDRIRQSILEEHLHWRIVRIWSTDWVRNPQRQLERILHAYEDAVWNSGMNEQKNADEGEADESESDLTPRYVDQKDSSRHSFSNIDDVPSGRIQASARDVLARAGATDWDDLVKLVARDLGFSKVGKRIRQRLELVLNEELQSGSLRWVGDRIAVP